MTSSRSHAPRLALGPVPRAFVWAWFGGSLDFVGRAGRDGFAGARELGRLLRALPPRRAASVVVIVAVAGAVPFLSILTALDVFRGMPGLLFVVEQPLLLCGGAAAMCALGVVAIDRPLGRSALAYVRQLGTRLHSLRATSGAVTRSSHDEGAVP